MARPGLYIAAGSLLSIQISSIISAKEMPVGEDGESPEEQATEAVADKGSGDTHNNDEKGPGMFVCRLYTKRLTTERCTTLTLSI